jgi:hypothetical protein
MEGAMKWEPRCSRKFSDICSFYSHTKLLENQVAMVSASAMQEELVQARLRILSSLIRRKSNTYRRSWEKKEPHGRAANVRKFMQL